MTQASSASDEDTEINALLLESKWTAFADTVSTELRIDDLRVSFVLSTSQ